MRLIIMLVRIGQQQLHKEKTWITTSLFVCLHVFCVITSELKKCISNAILI